MGGIIGYNAADTTLTLENASNGNQSQAQSYGGLALSPRADAANGGAYRLDSGVSLASWTPTTTATLRAASSAALRPKPH